MADTSSSSTSTTSTLNLPNKPAPMLDKQAVSPSSQSQRPSLLQKFRSQDKYGPEGSGKEKWRDTSLSEKERWKDWQKAKDKEQQRGSTAGTFTEFYKGKGKTGYWLAAWF